MDIRRHAERRIRPPAAQRVVTHQDRYRAPVTGDGDLFAALHTVEQFGEGVSGFRHAHHRHTVNCTSLYIPVQLPAADWCSAGQLSPSGRSGSRPCHRRGAAWSRCRSGPRTRSRPTRLDNSHEVEIRKLLRVDRLIIDDLALQPLDSVDTADIYELIAERHRAASTVITSNREPVPDDWLGLMADPLLAQSAIDRLQSAAHELVLDGESYRQRQKPTVTDGLDHPPPDRRSSRRRT
jgi:hypothetical protein